MLPHPSPRIQAWCHLALAALWSTSRAASLHGWWDALARLGSHATAAKLLGLAAAWGAVALAGTLVLGLPRAGWPMRGATVLALAGLLGGGRTVDAVDVAWLCLALPLATWTLVPAGTHQRLAQQGKN